MDEQRFCTVCPPWLWREKNGKIITLEKNDIHDAEDYHFCFAILMLVMEQN